MIQCNLHHLEARSRQRGYTLDEVRACIVSQDGDQIIVDENHPAYPKHNKNKMIHPVAEGPGTELKILLSKLGIHASPTCKCNGMAKKMNQMEAQYKGWCLEHIDEIVDVMQETAQKRGLPFIRSAGKILVKKAVKNWYKKIS
jgi:hypothetical protein